MIRLLKKLYEAKIAEVDSRIIEQKMAHAIAEASGLVTEKSDSDGWQKIISPTDTEKGFTYGDQREMIRQARKVFRFDPHARAIIQTMVNYIVGKGFNIQSKSDDKKVKFVWTEFWNSPRSKMRLKRFEIIVRAFRDGEVFLELFSKNAAGAESGLTTVRFLDPLLIKNPYEAKVGQIEGTVEVIRNGVEIDPNDVEKVVAYWVERRDAVGQFRRVAAENVVHVKLFADSDQRRGETFLQTVFTMIANYNNWLDNRIILNRMRSAIVLIRKVTGTAQEMNPLKGNFGPKNRADNSGKTIITGGKILTANEGVDYKMESPNINAGDVKDDGRNIKLAMSAGTQIPEYAFGDASNNNYASSLIAESPFVKAIEYWQLIFEEFIKELYRKVLENAVKSGKLQAPTDDEFMAAIFGETDVEEEAAVDDEKANDDPAADPANKPDDSGADDEGEDETEMADGSMETPTEIFYGCDIQWPEIIHREIDKQVSALMTARQNGWLADSTASAALGYDYDEEVRKQNEIEEAAKTEGNALLGGAQAQGDEGDMAAEQAALQQQLSTMTDDQKMSTFGTKDDNEIMGTITQKPTQSFGKKKPPVGKPGAPK